MTTGTPDYGLDAPDVVRNLLLVAGAGLLLSALILSGVLPRVVTIPLPGDVKLQLGLLGTALGPALGCGAGAIAMIWDSRAGKLAWRESFLDAVAWTGHESVLDVGCGRGLLLVGAARRVPQGQAVGLDLWRQEDLSANRPEATLANAEAEGVRDRVLVETGDMRQMPFDTGSFDRVVTRAAIHNLPTAADRARAIGEIARVLRPGGTALLQDIRHWDEYRATLSAAGCRPIRRLDSAASSWWWRILSFGGLAPATWVYERGPGA
jgi:SAM-dependent methyltransferase